jgi:hypothetical protein
MNCSHLMRQIKHYIAFIITVGIYYYILYILPCLLVPGKCIYLKKHYSKKYCCLKGFGTIDTIIIIDESVGSALSTLLSYSYCAIMLLVDGNCFVKIVVLMDDDDQLLLLLHNNDFIISFLFLNAR